MEENLLTAIQGNDVESLLAENAQLRAELIDAQNHHEIFFQKKLEKITGLKHEAIESDLTTDLSNDDVVIEIKRASLWRNAVSQLELYHHVKRMKLGRELEKILILFGPPWTGKTLERNLSFCKDKNIRVIWSDAKDFIHVRLN